MRILAVSCLVSVIAGYKAQADARQQDASSAMMPKMTPIETVGADKAPAPPGSGWFCYESRVTRYSPSSPKGEMKTSRPCHRTETACRADADAAARAKAGSPRERLEVTVSPCAPRKVANRTYYWFADGAGRHACVAGADDCQAQLLAVTTPGSAVRQSECREVK